MIVLMGSPSQSPVGQSPRCGLEGFTPNPAEHLVNVIESPIHVGKVRGTLRSEAGAWPDDVEVRFEIRGPGQATRVWGTRAEKDGRFVIRNVPPGTYCFRAMAIGWQSVVGRLVVGPGDGDRQAIALTLPLGVWP
jgi:hypothetical protein